MTPLPKPTALRSAAKVLHPQLPLNPRQSQQLLQILKTSFQKQLDLAHPPIEARNQQRGPSTLISGIDRQQSASFKNNASGKSITAQSSSAEHIDYILSNPLLSIQPNPSNFIFGGSTPVFITRNRFSNANKAKEWFRGCLASGDVSLDTVRSYLHDIHRTVNPLRGENGKKRMKEFDAGKDTLSWLNTSSLIKSLGFWNDDTSCSMLIRCLTAEDCLGEIQQLLLMEMHPDSGDASLNARRRRFIMNAWMSANFLFDVSRESMLKTFINFLHAFGDGGYSPSKTSLKCFHSAGSQISAAITSRGASIDTSLYVSFFETLRLWAPDLSIGRALVSLYHPTEPNAGPALQTMTHIKPMTITRMTTGQKRTVLKMCLDSAQRFLAQEDFEAGSRMLEYARTYCAEELGESKVPQSHSPANETILQRFRANRKDHPKEPAYVNHFATS